MQGGDATNLQGAEGALGVGDEAACAVAGEARGQLGVALSAGGLGQHVQRATRSAGAGQGGVGAAEQTGRFERGGVAHEAPGNVGMAVDEGATGLQLGAVLIAENKAAHVQALRHAHRVGGAPCCPAGFGEGFVEAVGLGKRVGLDDARRCKRAGTGVDCVGNRGGGMHFHRGQAGIGGTIGRRSGGRDRQGGQQDEMLPSGMVGSIWSRHVNPVCGNMNVCAVQYAPAVLGRLP